MAAGLKAFSQSPDRHPGFGRCCATGQRGDEIQNLHWKLIWNRRSQAAGFPESFWQTPLKARCLLPLDTSFTSTKRLMSTSMDVGGSSKISSTMNCKKCMEATGNQLFDRLQQGRSRAQIQLYDCRICYETYPFQNDGQVCRYSIRRASCEFPNRRRQFKDLQVKLMDLQTIYSAQANVEILPWRRLIENFDVINSTVDWRVHPKA